MSREATRLARTNRLPPLILYDVARSSLPYFYHIFPSLHLPSPPFLSVPPHILKRLWPQLVIYQASVRVTATVERRSILPHPMCQKPHLLYSDVPAEDMPISRPALSLAIFNFLLALSEMDLPNIFNVMASLP